MTKEEIYDCIRQLAKSQWCRWRLLRDIQEMDWESQKKFWKYLENQNFKSGLDCILFLEWNP